MEEEKTVEREKKIEKRNVKEERLDDERGKGRLIGEITVKKKREIGIRKDCEEEEGD